MKFQVIKDEKTLKDTLRYRLELIRLLSQRTLISPDGLFEEIKFISHYEWLKIPNEDLFISENDGICFKLEINDHKHTFMDNELLFTDLIVDDEECFKDFLNLFGWQEKDIVAIKTELDNKK